MLESSSTKFSCSSPLFLLRAALLLSTLIQHSSCFHHTCTPRSRREGTARARPQSSNAARYSRCTLAIASAAPEKDAVDFSSNSDDQNLDGNSNENSESSRAPVLDVQLERFHSDMLRVLSSRADRDIAALAEATLQERRKRPDILEHDKDGVQRVFTMLDRMVSIGLATEETFQIAMRACLQRGRLRWRNHPSSSTSKASQSALRDGTLPVICAADQMEGLLEQLEEITSDISLDTYKLVLEAYAACSTPRGGKYYAHKAGALLERMEEKGLFGANRIEDMDQVDDIPVDFLTLVLHAWAWQQANKEDGDCAQRANDYLDQIEQSNEKPRIDVLLQCYDWVLEAWSKSGSQGAGERANEVFLKMKELNQTQSTSAILDTQTYSNAILARTKCKEPQSAQQAHDLLVEMLAEFEKGSFPSSEPELIAFNGVITAWARNGKPAKAEEVLWLMDGLRSKCKDLVPDVVTYNSVLHAHVMSPDRTEALKQIRNLVKFMESSCDEQPAIRPDSFTYNTLMKAWIRSGQSDMPQEAESILRKMEVLWESGCEGVEPTNRHFNVVINAYAKSSDPFASTKALDLLQRMKGGHIRSKPDIITYTSVIECFSKSADPDASKVVNDLLEEAFAVHKETGDPAMRPNLRTFTMVILTMANCNGSIADASALLTRLVGLYEETKDEALMPNAYPYNYVINCAANQQEDKMQAFRLATQTYQEMRKSSIVSPDSYTYAFWFKCCNNLLKEDKELKAKCMFFAFEECKKDGLVSNTVINRLQRGIPPNVLEEWLGIAKRKNGFRDLKVNELPPGWSRNVR